MPRAKLNRPFIGIEPASMAPRLAFSWPSNIRSALDAADGQVSGCTGAAARFNIDKLRSRASANAAIWQRPGGVATRDSADATCAVEPEKPQGS